MHPISLYVHLPFCREKCGYCDFLSFAGMGDRMPDYVNALVHELQSHGITLGTSLDTVYIGGGTPSVLPIELIEEVVTCIRAHFDVAQNCEWTIELNPGTVDETYAKALFALGFNRASIGLQSTDNSLLEKLGRIHTYEKFEDTYMAMRQAGFANLNIDLMYALPGQSLQKWRDTLGKVIALNPEHISLYGLIVEEGTEFAKLHEAGELPLPSEEEEREMYWLANERLTQAGYIHYEISNYARQGMESMHNLGYWSDKQYIGAGLGASSYWLGDRFDNTDDMDAYIAADGNLNQIRTLVQKGTRELQMEECLFLGLRKMEGIDLEKYNRRFGDPFENEYKESFEKLKKEGLLTVEGGYLKLTEKGIDVSNYVFAYFIH